MNAESRSVWIVTEGDYSDYRIVDVFSDQESAAVCLDVAGVTARVNEWILDENLAEYRQGLLRWFVQVARDGTVEHVDCVGVGRSMMDLFVPVLDPVENRRAMQTEMFARDKEHAVTIANERRAMHIANSTWGINEDVGDDD